MYVFREIWLFTVMLNQHEISVHTEQTHCSVCVQIAAKLCEIKYRPVLWRRRSHVGLFDDYFNSRNIYEDKLIGQKGCTLSYSDLGNNARAFL